MSVEIDVKEWQKRSQNGIVCGFVGCYEKPTSQCPTCRNWYCYEHVKNHSHVMSDEEVQDRDRKQNEGK